MTRHVVIIGGGASGTLTAAHLLRQRFAPRQLRVTLIEARRGLLPQQHRMTQPQPLAAADIPFGTSLAYLLHWLRATIRAHVSHGGDWRDLIDGLRPHTRALWHHMPPDSARQIAEARSSGQLQLIRIGKSLPFPTSASRQPGLPAHLLDDDWQQPSPPDLSPHRDRV